MPFIPHTPEALIPRSDSKNPSSTCKGITSSGRLCRRSLAPSLRSSPCTSPNRKSGVLAVVPNFDDNNEGAGAFFCWQHKEQADTLAGASAAKVVEVSERTSIDTLVDRLGVLEIDDRKNGIAKKKKRAGQAERPVKRPTLLKQWQNVPGPLLSVPEDSWAGGLGAPPKPKSEHARQRKAKGESHFTLSFFCCTRAADPDELPAPRIRHIPAGRRQPEMAHRPTPQPRNRASLPHHLTSATPLEHPTISPPPLNPTPPSQTRSLLGLIPPTLSPHSTSLLLSELVKPSSPEPGYIYMFWLTPASTPAPSSTTASSLLSAPPTPHLRTSDVLRPFTLPTADGTTAPPTTILLKIGRASNVHRRLNEWTRQCNHHLSLIRYYPYPPSPASPLPVARDASKAPSPGAGPQTAGLPEASAPRKVPYVHRVERLIHLELAEKRVKRQCVGCGKEHREWFEVEASREGVRGVDEVVRRWVRYGEGLEGS